MRHRGTLMQDFAQQIAAWQPYFATLAAACATLVGLLFVALSLQTGILRDEGKTNLHRLAHHTFGDFVQVLFIGVFYVVPVPVPTFFGIATVMIVAFGLPELGRRFLEAWHDRDHKLHRSHIMHRLLLSCIGRGLLALGGLGLLLQHAGSEQVSEDLMFVFSGSVSLLISGLRNAWFLLIQEQS